MVFMNATIASSMLLTTVVYFLFISLKLIKALKYIEKDRPLEAFKSRIKEYSFVLKVFALNSVMLTFILDAILRDYFGDHKFIANGYLIISCMLLTNVLLKYLLLKSIHRNIDACEVGEVHILKAKDHLRFNIQDSFTISVFIVIGMNLLMKDFKSFPIWCAILLGKFIWFGNINEVLSSKFSLFFERNKKNVTWVLIILLYVFLIYSIHKNKTAIIQGINYGLILGGLITAGIAFYYLKKDKKTNAMT